MVKWLLLVVLLFLCGCVRFARIDCSRYYGIATTDARSGVRADLGRGFGTEWSTGYRMEVGEEPGWLVTGGVTWGWKPFSLWLGGEVVEPDEFNWHLGTEMEF
jgi:hypothetical protein